MFEIIRDFFMFADTPLNAAIANYGMILVFAFILAFILGSALRGLYSVSREPLWKFYKLLDHWTYERKWTKCEKCNERAFCYYGVSWPCKNDIRRGRFLPPPGGGFYSGFGCPSCKQEQTERKAAEMRALKEDQGTSRNQAPIINRRAAVMATRKKYGEV